MRPTYKELIEDQNFQKLYVNFFINLNGAIADRDRDLFSPGNRNEQLTTPELYPGALQAVVNAAYNHPELQMNVDRQDVQVLLGTKDKVSRLLDEIDVDARIEYLQKRHSSIDKYAAIVMGAVAAIGSMFIAPVPTGGLAGGTVLLAGLLESVDAEFCRHKRHPHHKEYEPIKNNLSSLVGNASARRFDFLY